MSRLIHLAELLTGNPNDAPDLVQAAMIKVYPRWSRIEADDPTAYVRRVMINHQNDWWRRKRLKEVPTDRLLDAADRSDLAGDHERRAVVLAALRGLTRRERQQRSPALARPRLRHRWQRAGCRGGRHSGLGHRGWLRRHPAQHGRWRVDWPRRLEQCDDEQYGGCIAGQTHHER